MYHVSRVLIQHSMWHFYCSPRRTECNATPATDAKLSSHKFHSSPSLSWSWVVISQQRPSASIHIIRHVQETLFTPADLLGLVKQEVLSAATRNRGNEITARCSRDKWKWLDSELFAPERPHVVIHHGKSVGLSAVTLHTLLDFRYYIDD